MTKKMTGHEVRQSIRNPMTVVDLLRLADADEFIDCNGASDLFYGFGCPTATAHRIILQAQDSLIELDFSRWVGDWRPYKLTPTGRALLKQHGY